MQDRIEKTTSFAKRIQAGARWAIQGLAHAKTHILTSRERRYIWGATAVFSFVFAVSLLAVSQPVAITLDGSEQTVSTFASLNALYAESGASVVPGNFVAVDGSVLEEGQGEQFSANVNGEDLTKEQMLTYFPHAGDTVLFSAGTDICEPFSVEETSVIEPKLERIGEHGAITFVKTWPQAGVSQKRHGLVSNIEAECVAEPAQNAVLVTKNVEPADGERVVALTFDDGPSEYTQQYLDILNQYGAHATFFELGAEVDKDPSATTAVRDSGMGLGTHTYGHEEASKLTPQDLQNTLRKGIDTLAQQDVATSMLRPPYGDFPLSAWLNSGGLISSVITWNQDSQDWKRPGTDAITAHALANIQPGSIILMHDGGGNRDQDVAALPGILQALANEGYRIVSVQELLATDPSIPQDVAAGTATMPSTSTWPEELQN